MGGFVGGTGLVDRESVLYCRMKASPIIPLVKQAVEDIKPYLKKLEWAGKKKCDLER